MTLPRWLDDELHGRGRVIAAAVGLLVLLGWALWMAWGRGVAAPAAPAARAPAPAVSAAPAAEPVATVAAATSSPAPLAICAHQHLEVSPARAVAGEVQRGCVSDTRTRQDGSVRRYSVEPEGLSAWRLDAELAAEAVLSVRLQRMAAGAVPEQWYACDGPACQGVSLGAANEHGVRALSFAETRLRALPPGQSGKRRLAAAAAGASAASAEEANALRLSAVLKVLPQRSGSALACTGLGVKVLDSRGAATDFCPLGGAGFALDDADHLRFEFRDLDGRELVVALAADRSVASVSLGGASCKAPHCGGVSMRAAGDAADPAVQRSFAFSGTSLFPNDPNGPDAARMTLDGSVTMPAQ